MLREMVEGEMNDDKGMIKEDEGVQKLDAREILVA